jgi:CRP-like cAMP-binding protein
MSSSQLLSASFPSTQKPQTPYPISCQQKSLVGGCPQSHPDGVELFLQGSAPTHIYFLDRGVVKLTRNEHNGGAIILGLHTPGDLIGTAAAVSQREHQFAATTVGPCQLTEMSVSQFHDLLRVNMSFSMWVLNCLSIEAEDHHNRIAQLACCSARQRLEYLLWQFVHKMGAGQLPCRLRVGLKQWELANLLAVTPAYLCKLIKELEDDGLLCRKGGWLLVCRLDDLWRG